MTRRQAYLSAILSALLILLTTAPAAAATARSSARKWTPKGRAVVKAPAAKNKKKRKPVPQEVWTVPSYADSTIGDMVDGEDLTVRRAAVDALGPFNGSVVVVEPDTGRVLTIVNQKLAFRSGFTPCSTVKIVAALGGLLEGHIDRNTEIPVTRTSQMTLTDAMAKSNNPYFAQLGLQLGFDKVTYYARLFGLGERAGLNIDQERAGTLPQSVPREGLGMMTSFGSGINLTPLQLAALVSAVANNGTLYWLQYPRSREEARNFVPQVKRYLPIDSVVDELKPGMAGAVQYGTGRRAAYDDNEPIFGKTGTCTHSDEKTHLGWFGSFNEVNGRKLAVVVLLTGGRPVNGPAASQVAGEVYKNLSRGSYVVNAQARFTPNPKFLRVSGPVNQ
jgi:cell division protein FtsI/penicillin-binding protein 2